MAHIPDEILNRMDEIAKDTVDTIMRGVNEGNIPDEESITDRFAQGIEMNTQIKNTFSDEYRSYEWGTKIKTFNKKSEEPEFGADIAITIRFVYRDPADFDFFLPHNHRGIRNITYQKTVLLQCKRETTNPFKIHSMNGNVIIDVPLTNTKIGELISQCSKMQDHSEHSFVLIYGKTNFYIINAQEFLNTRANQIQITNSISFSDFYKELWACRYGDYSLINWEDPLYEEFYQNVRPRKHLIQSIKIRRIIK